MFYLIVYSALRDQATFTQNANQVKSNQIKSNQTAQANFLSTLLSVKCIAGLHVPATHVRVRIPVLAFKALG
jgi:hypothetical protein